MMANSDDIPIDDFVLLQLFKDNLLNPNNNTPTAASVVSDQLSTDDSELSELESVISHEAKEYCSPSRVDSNFSFSQSLPKENRLDDRGDTSKRSAENFLESQQQIKNRRLGKDDKLAKEAKLPFTVRTLVGLPMDEFNDLLSKNELTEGQLNVCRDIRRRGKNKVAAQNCRQRKLEQIEELQQQLGRAMERRDKMKHEHNRLYNVYNLEAEKLRHITECVLKHFNKDVANYSLQVSGENVNILPRTEIKEEVDNSLETFHQFLPINVNTFYNNLNHLNNNFNETCNSQVDPSCQSTIPHYDAKNFTHY